MHLILTVLICVAVQAIANHTRGHVDETHAVEFNSSDLAGHIHGDQGHNQIQCYHCVLGAPFSEHSDPSCLHPQPGIVPVALCPQNHSCAAIKSEDDAFVIRACGMDHPPKNNSCINGPPKPEHQISFSNFPQVNESSMETVLSVVASELRTCFCSADACDALISSGRQDRTLKPTEESTGHNHQDSGHSQTEHSHGGNVQTQTGHQNVSVSAADSLPLQQVFYLLSNVMILSTL